MRDAGVGSGGTRARSGSAAGLGLIARAGAGGDARPSVQGPESGLAQEPARAADFELPFAERGLAAVRARGSVAAVAGVSAGAPWFGLASLTVGPSLGFLYGGCWGTGFC